ncbi:phosphotransferase family protein [Oceanirhabdus sp. W0125-5]|uniref:phosphotransferase family protein n=1 Tax=Oceanirhabdus sp. W0125-5 TaxID=2999116 RepID=UPI0022F34791|nr:aminoglycoside phosphotransferase family protein [Oceanirhabdus sp. W0125-5]WBW96686.1 aminoglycoside phosphotransferase family protein [Oceanirhabdus sp. W0125-5]
MSDRTERVNKVIEINLDIADKLIKLYKADYCVEKIERFAGGKSTSNYKVKIKDLDLELVLRVYPQKSAICEKEHTLSQKLKKVVPIPEMYYLNTDKMIIDKSYSIIEYLDGITLDEYIERNNKFPESLAREIGEKLALLHHTEYHKEGLLDNNLNLTDELPPILLWYKHFLNGIAGSRLEESTKSKLIKFIENNNDLLIRMTKKFVLCHGDFRPANLLVKDNKLVGILDWEFSLSAPCYFDIGQFTRVEEYMLYGVQNSFIEGYNSNAKYPLTDDWRKLSKLMDLANLLSFLNAKDEKPNLYQNMKALIDKSLEFLIEN